MGGVEALDHHVEGVAEAADLVVAFGEADRRPRCRAVTLSTLSAHRRPPAASARPTTAHVTKATMATSTGTATASSVASTAAVLVELVDGRRHHDRDGLPVQRGRHRFDAPHVPVPAEIGVDLADLLPMGRVDRQQRRAPLQLTAGGDHRPSGPTTWTSVGHGATSGGSGFDSGADDANADQLGRSHLGLGAPPNGPARPAGPSRPRPRRRQRHRHDRPSPRAVIRDADGADAATVARVRCHRRRGGSRRRGRSRCRRGAESRGELAAHVADVHLDDVGVAVEAKSHTWWRRSVLLTTTPGRCVRYSRRRYSRAVRSISSSPAEHRRAAVSSTHVADHEWRGRSAEPRRMSARSRASSTGYENGFDRKSSAPLSSASA